MVLHPQTTGKPNQSTAPAVTHQPPSQQPGGGCDCSLPPDASSQVKSARLITVLIIAIHALALVVLGFFNLWQWLASLMTIISGSVLLCQFNKCAYTTAAILYAIGFIFDLLAVIAWLITDNGALSILPSIGAVTVGVGAVFTFIAIYHWDQSGAPDVVTVHDGPNVSFPPPGYPVAAVRQQQLRQAQNKGPPPAYVGAV